MLEFKEITLTDIIELSEMFTETFNAPPWNNKLTAETAVKRLHQAINIEDFYGLAAYQGDILCGMILGSKEQMFDGITFDVREFCVRNSLRGHGIGTELMIEFEKRLKFQGVSEIMLYTLKDDELVGFYKKCGLSTYDYIVMMGKRL